MISRLSLPRTLNAPAIQLIKRFEGLGDGDPKTVNLDPYMDSVGVWTIGWGHALQQGGILLRGEGNRVAAKNLYPGGITKVEAEALLVADAMTACADVNRWLATYVFPSNPAFTLTDNQHGALGSWFFNLGYKDETVNSTLLRRVRAGRWMEAQAEFEKWRLAGGKVEPGLVLRRACEAALFGTPDDLDAEAVIEKTIKRMREKRA